MGMPKPRAWYAQLALCAVLGYFPAVKTEVVMQASGGNGLTTPMIESIGTAATSVSGGSQDAVTSTLGPLSADSAQVDSAPSPGVLAYLCEQQDHLASSVQSPVGVYIRSLNQGFHKFPNQAAVAVVALVMGALCSWNGPGTWQALFTAAGVGAATSLARIEAEAWQLDIASELLLMFQAAFATGVAIQSGFDGFQVLFGTLLGAFGCYGCGGWARYLNDFIPGFAMLWYSLGAMLGALTLTLWQQPMLVTLGPLVGGFLVVSGLECLLAKLFSVFGGGDAANSPSLMPSPDTPWIDVATDLLVLGHGTVAAHGACAVLATLVYKSGAGDARRLPAVLCLLPCVGVSAVVAAIMESVWLIGACVLWAVITAVSAYYQLGLLMDWKAKTFSEVAETFSNAGSSYWGRMSNVSQTNNNWPSSGYETIRDDGRGLGLGVS